MDSFVYMRLLRWLYRRGGQRKTRRVRWSNQQFWGMGLYRLRGTVRYPAQAASVRSSLSRVRYVAAKVMWRPENTWSARIPFVLKSRTKSTGWTIPR